MRPVLIHYITAKKLWNPFFQSPHALIMRQATFSSFFNWSKLLETETESKNIDKNLPKFLFVFSHRTYHIASIYNYHIKVYT